MQVVKVLWEGRLGKIATVGGIGRKIRKGVAGAGTETKLGSIQKKKNKMREMIQKRARLIVKREFSLALFVLFVLQFVADYILYNRIQFFYFVAVVLQNTVQSFYSIRTIFTRTLRLRFAPKFKKMYGLKLEHPQTQPNCTCSYKKRV